MSNTAVVPRIAIPYWLGAVCNAKYVTKLSSKTMVQIGLAIIILSQIKLIYKFLKDYNQFF